MLKEKRMIDANAMRDDWLENGENEYVYDTNAVLESIDSQPTVDAVEVVHGRWLEDTYCSNCHWFAEDEEKHIVQSFHNYCPNCGAKMDG